MKLIVILKSGVTIGCSIGYSIMPDETEEAIVKRVRGTGETFTLKNAFLINGDFKVGNLDLGLDCPRLEISNSEIAVIGISR